MKNKLNELQAVLSSQKFDVILISETWLDDSVSDAMLTCENSYRILRKDRPSRGGGVCVLTKSAIRVSAIELPAKFSSLEVAALDLYGIDLSKLRIVCQYRAPESLNLELEKVQLMAELNGILSSVDFPVVFCGDYNCRSIDWSVPSVPEANLVAGIFLESAMECGLTQLVDFPTHTEGGLLDCVFVNQRDLVIDLSAAEPLAASCDHTGIQFRLNFSLDRAPKAFRTITDYRKGNYDAIKERISTFDWAAAIRDSRDIDELYSAFCCLQKECIRDFIPTRTVKARGIAYPAKIRLLAKEKATLHKRRDQSVEDDALYKISCKRYSQALLEFHRKRESEVINSGNLRAFFNFANAKLKGTNKDVGPIKRDDGTLTVDDNEKAQLFNAYFASVFTKDDGRLPVFTRRVEAGEGIYNVLFPPELVAKKLQQLPNKFSRAPDGIPAYYLKQVAPVIAVPLSRLFELSMESGRLPGIWKDAIVVPVFKKGVSCQRANYRPVSLTCICCKVMESIISDSFLVYLRRNNLITDEQFGFLSRRSVGLQLLSALGDWVGALDAKKRVDVMYIDFAKAFDSVSHPKLLAKLQSYGVGYELYNWLANFLTPRRQRVVVNNCFSDYVEVVSGVPQGSVLGPLLFLLYVNDLPDIFRTKGSVCKLFADDAKAYQVIETAADSERFSESLADFCDWSEEWQLNIALQKCSVLSLGRKVEGMDAKCELNGSVIQSVDMVRDLGILVDDNLSFSAHCSDVASRAHARVAMIFRAFQASDMSVLLRAYTTYVRPLLEFETFVWSPHYVKDITSLEKVQGTFTRRLYHRCSFPHVADVVRLSELRLEPLEKRRHRNDLIMCFKILRGLVDLDSASLFQLRSDSCTRGNALKLRHAKFRLDTAKYFFSNRVFQAWNALPNDVVLSPNVECFKRNLDRLMP